MEQITQQTLDFDRKDAFEQDKDVKALKDKNNQLMEELNTFKDAIASIHTELNINRKQLKILEKKYKVNKKTNYIIMEYVQENSGKKFMDIARYMEDNFGYLDGSGFVTKAKQVGCIVENLDGIFTVGKKPPKNSGVTDEIMKFAKDKEWFELSECFNFVNEKHPTITRTNIISPLSKKNKFDIDRSGKFIKYRLKDEYRK